MRTTSRILGIIGSALAILLGGLAVCEAASPAYYDDYYDYEYYDNEEDYDAVVMPAADDTLPNEDGSLPDEGADWDYVDVTSLVFGGLTVLGGLLGVIASICVSKRNVLAGTLFIISAVITTSAFIPMVLFIIAAVYALNKPKQPAPPVMIVPVPAGVYPGYYPATFPPPGPSGPSATPYPYYGAYPPPPPTEGPAAAYQPNAAYPPPPPFAAGQPGPAAYPSGVCPSWSYVYPWAAAPPQGPASPPNETNKINEINKEVE